MPAECSDRMKRCMQHLRDKGYSEESAARICRAKLGEGKDMAVGGVLLFELTQSSNVKVNREAGMIQGVRVIGPVSQNGRRYLPAALRGAKSLYEGVRVNFDHPPKADPDRERSIGDRAGWLQSVREDADGGLSADLHLLKADPRTEKIFEAAERRPELFGLSHNAEGRIRQERGKTVVEEILRVRSVDLVSDPASTRSLFEQQETHTVTKTMREILEAAFGDKAKRLFEQDAAMAPEMPVEAPAEGDSADQIKAAFRQAVMAAFDDEALDTAATLKKIKEILQAYDKLTAKEESSESGGEKAPTAESVQAELKKLQGELAAHRLLEAAGIPADDIRVKAIAALSTEGERKALVESWRGNGRSAGEKPHSTPARIRESRETKLPETTDEFVSQLRS